MRSLRSSDLLDLQDLHISKIFKSPRSVHFRPPRYSDLQISEAFKSPRSIGRRKDAVPHRQTPDPDQPRPQAQTAALAGRGTHRNRTPDPRKDMRGVRRRRRRPAQGPPCPPAEARSRCSQPAGPTAPGSGRRCASPREPLQPYPDFRQCLQQGDATGQRGAR